MMHNLSSAILLHATCIAIGERAVLLMGPSGAGKSDVALRLIDGGARLVADDQVVISRDDNRLMASPPESLRGLLEVRGVGILSLPSIDNIPLQLAVSLVSRDQVERLPEPAFFDCLNVQLPLLSLHAFDASTPTKIRMKLQLL